MANNLQNTAKIASYQYTVGTDNTNITIPIQDTTNNVLVEGSFSLTKTYVTSHNIVDNTKYADINEQITLNYTITNTTPAPSLDPIATAITIQDDVLILPANPADYELSITAGSGITNYDSTTGTITVTIPNGQLRPGQSVECSLTLVALPKMRENGFNTVLSTTATATITRQNVAGASTKTAIDYLKIVNGELTITKTSNRSGDTLSIGSIIIYTITINNLGNTDSTIAIGDFTDTLDTRIKYTVGSIDNTAFEAKTVGPDTVISNVAAVTVSKATPVVLTFSVEVQSV